jgi:hypothetical protein
MPIKTPWRIEFVSPSREAASRNFKADLQKLAPRVDRIVELGTGVRIWIDSTPDTPDRHVSVLFRGFVNGAGALEIEGLVKLVPKVRP